MTTFIRAVEAFIIVLFTAFFAQLTISGQPLDATSKDGQSRIVSAFLAAVLVAIRQYFATRGSTPSGTTPTPPPAG